ncbi:ArsR/SmtB family transcription factor [Pantoea agglomerans]|uniref:ArsR/SmtB family transcription factor n=1 Tax=Enterobacter agglomerans TaxID=549 RepID=UPI0010C2193A|nr:metalloregulator ArsR/SmtB family transcription factor [Pantoea agglomerans]MBD8145446.1 helix-turn-helix transcriptional regulator [Pantoea agglomerans]MBD8184179.1 helix-turn-helix transcriptional regulator [Pantoea agglomerans]MBD8223110.1 helix-turn-helix transcriptional regulator [Pantoea agglomerans]TKJ53904.1 transcriptional regulator [Pantoea agglomerans]TKK16189.1 transcriptional regulator [Pantoea agglomerans]
MDIQNAAAALRELGHVTRLGIYRELVKAGPEGLPVGDIQKRLAIPASTLSHHLSALMSAGLISQERQSRILFCRPCYAQLEQLMAFLTEECCAGGSGCSLPTTNTHKETLL